VRESESKELTKGIIYGGGGRGWELAPKKLQHHELSQLFICTSSLAASTALSLSRPPKRHHVLTDFVYLA
jgi:hypothetical protein